ncbi:MAG: HD-GYP domain-containing protein [Lachnospiraceae bacterium]|nr:HD-GYP domain-containing protein [Lachnospiraceae bacterium]
MVVSRFSELIKEKHEINWKLFIIPPLAFSIPYSSIALMMLLDFANDDVVFFSAFFSVVIVFLFIWAFYVIIKNMMATNEAIKAKDEIKTLSVEVMEALAHTIDAKDEYTKGHSVRVAKYSRMLAERLGLSDEDCESVYYMALLHDIGKIGVPNEIINGKSKMTDEEYAVMKTHPVVGSDILSEIKSRPDLMIGARWHHERYDGKGYPDGKAGDDIPYFARIISVADSYDAMTSNRSYRKYLPQDVVRSEIEKNCGTQFDPNIAKCMISVIDEDVNYEYHE